MRTPNMMTAIKDYERRMKEEIRIGVRIWVTIDGIKTPATKAEVIEAVKNYKTVKRI